MKKLVLFGLLALLLVQTVSATSTTLNTGNAINSWSGASGVMGLQAKDSFIINSWTFETNTITSNPIVFGFYVDGALVHTVPSASYGGDAEVTLSGLSVFVPKDSNLTFKAVSGSLNMNRAASYKTNDYIQDSSYSGVNPIGQRYHSPNIVLNSTDGYNESKTLKAVAFDNYSSSYVNTGNCLLYDENMTLLTQNALSNGYYRFNMGSYGAGNYTIAFESDDYVNIQKSIYYDNTNETVNFLTSISPLVTINVYDDETNNLITENISIELWSDTEAYILSTVTGTLSQPLNSEGDFNIKFYGDDYPLKHYFFNINYNETKAINLYLTNATNLQNVTATIQDQNLNALEGAVLVIEKHSINTGNYLISERISADFEGKARFKATLFDDYYRFKIYYDDELVFNSNPTTIKSEEISFIITITDGVTEGFNDILNIDYLHYFDSVNNRFVFTYSNAAGTVTGINVYTHRLMRTGETLTDTTSQTSGSGTIYHSVNNITGYNYKSCAYGVIEDNSEELISCEFVEFDTAINEESQTLALFWLLMVTILFAMASLYNITIGLIITPLPFLAFEILGLTTLGLPYAISIQVLFIVVGLVINK